LAELWFSGVSIQHHELVPEGQVREQLLGPLVKGCGQTPKGGRNYAKLSPSGLMNAPGGSKDSIGDQVLAIYRGSKKRRCLSAACG
jgi:hypothetical protein